MIVIKLGGNALSKAHDLTWVSTLKARIERGEKFIIVHGGGPQIDDELGVHNIEKKFIDGFRYTDEKTFEIVEMVLAGSVQQQLVRLLRSFGMRAVGIAGNDGALLTAVKKLTSDGTDLGQVGEIESVDTRLLSLLLSEGFIPVVTPVSGDAKGNGFNVNADIAAAAIAGALSADAAIFMTDVAGIYRHFPDQSSLIDEISLAELSDLHGTLSGGMLPKVEAVKKAIESGASCAYVIDGRDGKALSALLDGSKVGTKVIRG